MLLHTCEEELTWSDMKINVKKSCCLRIGPRNHVNCAEVLTLSGQSVPWASVMRYLGIFIVRSKFKCSFEAAKRSFYRTANSIFGKIGRSASEETTLQLIQSKCIPCIIALLYGLEACPTNKSDLRSLDFVLWFLYETVQNCNVK